MLNIEYLTFCKNTILIWQSVLSLLNEKKPETEMSLLCMFFLNCIYFWKISSTDLMLLPFYIMYFTKYTLYVSLINEHMASWEKSLLELS